MSLALHLAAPPAIPATSIERAGSSQSAGIASSSSSLKASPASDNNTGLTLGKATLAPPAPLLSALLNACVRRLARWAASSDAPKSKQSPPIAADARSWAASAEEWVLASDSTAVKARAIAAANESNQDKSRINSDGEDKASGEHDGDGGIEDNDFSYIGGSAAAKARLAREQAAARANGVLLALEHARKQGGSNGSDSGLNAKAQRRRHRSRGNASSDSSSDDDEQDDQDGNTSGSVANSNALLHQRSAFSDEDLVRGRNSAWEIFCSRINCSRSQWPTAALELVPRVDADAAVAAAVAAASAGAQSVGLKPNPSDDASRPSPEMEVVVAAEATEAFSQNVQVEGDAAKANNDGVQMPLVLPTPAVWTAVIAVCLAHTESVFAAFATPGRSTPASSRQTSGPNSSSTVADGAAAGLVLIEAWQNILKPLKCLISCTSQEQASVKLADSTGRKTSTDVSSNHEFDPLAALLPLVLKARLVGCVARLTAAARAVAGRLQRSSISYHGGSGDGGDHACGNGSSVGVALNYPSAESMALLVALPEGSISTTGANDSGNGNSSAAESIEKRTGVGSQSGLESDSSSESDDSSVEANGHQVGRILKKRPPKKGDSNLIKRQRNFATSDGEQQTSVEEDPQQEQSPRASSEVRFWAPWLTGLRDGSSGNGDNSGAIARRATEVLMDGELLIYDLHNLRATLVSRSARDNNSMPAWEDDLDDDHIDRSSSGNSSSEVSGEIATLLWLDTRLKAALTSFALANGGDFAGSSSKNSASGGEKGAASATWTNPLAAGSLGRKRGRASRLRSRNRVIDSWLEDEDGRDAYADLEGFIVD